MQRLKTIAWHEASRNRYGKAMHPAMLLKQGYVTTMDCTPIGDKYEPGCYQVRFGKDYVIHWLAKKFFKPFANIPVKELEKILNDAYQYENNNPDAEIQLVSLESN